MLSIWIIFALVTFILSLPTYRRYYENLQLSDLFSLDLMLIVSFIMLVFVWPVVLTSLIFKPILIFIRVYILKGDTKR